MVNVSIYSICKKKEGERSEGGLRDRYKHTKIRDIEIYIFIRQIQRRSNTTCTLSARGKDRTTQQKNISRTKASH